MPTTPRVDLTDDQGSLHGTAMTTEPGSTAAPEAISRTALTDCDEPMPNIEQNTRSADRPAWTTTDIEFTLDSKYGQQSAMQRDTLIAMTQLFGKNGGTPDVFTTVCGTLKEWGQLANPNVELAVWQTELAAQLCWLSAETGCHTFLHDSQKLLTNSKVSKDELREGKAVWMYDSGLDRQNRPWTSANIKFMLIMEYGLQSATQRDTLIKMSQLFRENGGTVEVFTTVCGNLKDWGQLDNPNTELAVWQNELASQLCDLSVECYPAFLYYSRELLVNSEVSEDELREGNAFWRRNSKVMQDSSAETAPSGDGLTGYSRPVRPPRENSRLDEFRINLDGLIGRRGG